MKKTFTEEEYQEIKKLYSKEVLKNYYEDQNNYIEYDGYENLNNCNLLPEEYKLLWKLQDLLFSYDELKEKLSDEFHIIFESIKNPYNDLINSTNE